MGRRGIFLLLYEETCPESALITSGASQFFFKPQFHEHHKNSLKIEKNTLKLKPTLLCLAFHGLECHLLPPVNKANINTLLCLLFFYVLNILHMTIWTLKGKLQ